MLRKLVILRAGRTSEMIKGQAEPIGDARLHFMHLSAEISNWFTSLGGSKLGRSTMLVCGTKEQHLVATRALVAGEEIGRQLRADEVAEMFDAIDVRDGGGYEVPGHVVHRLWIGFASGLSPTWADEPVPGRNLHP